MSRRPRQANHTSRRLASWRVAGLAALLALAGLGARAEHVVLESFQEDQGLTTLAPQCMAQDAQSRLWICTDNGLFRFDGFRIRPEFLPSEAGSYLYGARVDARGRLWVLAEGGVYVREDGPRGPQWTEVLRPNGKHLHVLSGQQIEFTGSDTVHVIDDDRLLWTASVGGPLGTSLTVQRAAIPPLRGAPDQLIPIRRRGETLWFGCGQQLCEWRDGRVQPWGVAQGLPEDFWAQLLVSRDGSLWARSNRRLARLAPGAERFSVVDAPTRGWMQWDQVLAEDARGAILTTSDRGIAAWNGERWREWGRADGLPDTAINLLTFDAEGSLWLAASGRGIHRWVGYGQSEHWTEASGLPSPAVLDLARDGSGRLWAATGRGVAWFDDSVRRFRPVALPATPSLPVHRLAVTPAGDLWWIQGGQLITVKSGSTDARVNTRDSGLVLVSSGTGHIYATGESGLERLELQDGRLRREKIGEGVFDPRYDIRVLSEGPRDDFVINGRDLWTRREGGWTRVVDDRGEWVDALEAMVKDGTLWASGTPGVGVYTLSGHTARLRQRLPQSDFGNATAASVRSGHDGAVWMATDHGVFIHAADGRWTRLDRRTGLIWNDATGAFLADADGSTWIGTSAGVTRLLPPIRTAPLPALRPEEIAFGGTVWRTPPVDPVAWEDRFLRITLGTAGFSRARSLQVQYRLGTNAPWRTSQTASIDLGALEAGTHTLETRAVGLAPVEAPGPVWRMVFVVRPPWWNSTVARAAFVATLLMLWWLSIRWLRRRDRMRQRQLEIAVAERTAALASSEVALRRLGEHNAQALEEERLRVSRELHDELGQQLAALKMEVSVGKGRPNSSKPVKPLDPDVLLGRVDRLVSTVRGLVSQLRPPALDGGLEAALQWLASEFTLNTTLPCSLQVDPDTREIPQQTATMVFRIAQESLTNVRRHAQASRVDLSLTREGDGWLLLISDDGIGFDPSTRRAGFGVLGMQERARLLGGTLEVHSEPAAGTRVLLHIPATSR